MHLSQVADILTRTNIALSAYNTCYISVGRSSRLFGSFGCEYRQITIYWRFPARDLGNPGRLLAARVVHHQTSQHLNTRFPSALVRAVACRPFTSLIRHLDSKFHPAHFSHLSTFERSFCQRIFPLRHKERLYDLWESKLTQRRRA